MCAPCCAAVRAKTVCPSVGTRQNTTSGCSAASIRSASDEGLKHSQVMETLSYLTDVYGPRLTGSPSLRRAQAWAQQQLKDWGLANVREEPYEFGRGWELKHFSAHMIAPSYAPLIAYPKA